MNEEDKNIILDKLDKIRERVRDIANELAVYSDKLAEIGDELDEVISTIEGEK